MAGFAFRIWQMVKCPQAIHPLGEERHLAVVVGADASTPIERMKKVGEEVDSKKFEFSLLQAEERVLASEIERLEAELLRQNEEKAAAERRAAEINICLISQEHNEKAEALAGVVKKLLEQRRKLRLPESALAHPAEPVFGWTRGVFKEIPASSCDGCVTISSATWTRWKKNTSCILCCEGENFQGRGSPWNPRRSGERRSAQKAGGVKIRGRHAMWRRASPDPENSEATSPPESSLLQK